MSDFELSFPDGDYTFYNLRSEKPWSYCGGTTLTIGNMIAITVESRWAGEKALSVNGQFHL